MKLPKLEKTKIMFSVICIGILLLQPQFSDASLNFITLKDEVEYGYHQYRLREKVDDMEKLKNIQEIGNKLAKVSRKRQGIDYIFSLIQQENAFSSFAGFIYIGVEMYNLASNEDELAFIIAHEMAHSDNRDTANAMEDIIAKKYQKDEKVKISEEMLSDYFYSRIQEYTADAQATLYLYLAGFNPEAGIKLMDKLESSYPELYEKVVSHPSTINRKRNIEAFLSELKYVEKFYFRDGERYLNEKNYDDAVRYFSGFLSYFYNKDIGYFKRGYAYYLKATSNSTTDEFIWDDGVDWTKEELKESQNIDVVSLMKAENDLHEAIRLNPDNANYYNYSGIIKFKLGKTKEAIENFKMAIEKDNNLCAGHNNLGIVYAKSENLKEAEEYFTICLSKCPNSLPATFNLAKIYQRGGDEKRAVEYFNKYLQLDKNKKSYWRKTAQNQVKGERR